MLSYILAVLIGAAGFYCRVVVGSQLDPDEFSSMFLRFYTSKSIYQIQDIYLNKARDLVPLLNLSRPNVIYIHGYTGSSDGKDTKTVISAYLARDDHNVMSLDWREVAGRTYPIVVRKADAVGRALADAMNEMTYQGLPQNNIHIVGHSMGAQVAGYASRQTNFTLSRITGLDPAGPFFHLLETHLSSKDANFVDTIHTDAGYYGINRAIGLASFYPNGGRRIQPGCPNSYGLMSPEDFHTARFDLLELVNSVKYSIASYGELHLRNSDQSTYAYNVLATQNDRGLGRGQYIVYVKRMVKKSIGEISVLFTSNIRCIFIDATVNLGGKGNFFAPSMISNSTDFCSHHRSWILYAESLGDEDTFIASKCPSFQKFLNGDCLDNERVTMGYNTPTNTEGTFYLRTRDEAPFGLRMDGAQIAKKPLQKEARLRFT